LELPDDLRAIFLSVTTIFAFMNLTGVPKKVVSRQWEETGFGELFFPFDGMKNKDRRFLAGIIESLGILLTLTRFVELRGWGYAIPMVMYGRGALVNARIQLWKALATGSVSFVAGLLLKDEFYTVL
jgi:hypothetical protein